jgi:hypothetical protein
VMKSIVLWAASVSAASVCTALFGTGVAAADNFAGQKYGDARTVAGNAGLSVIISSRVGDKTSLDQCIVASSQASPFMHNGDHVTKTVLFNLNCYAEYASTNSPGPSIASPQGREAKAAAEQAAAQEQQQLEQASAPTSNGQ